MKRLYEEAVYQEKWKGGKVKITATDLASNDGTGEVFMDQSMDDCSSIDSTLLSHDADRPIYLPICHRFNIFLLNQNHVNLMINTHGHLCY